MTNVRVHVATQNHLPILRCDVDPSCINLGTAFESRFDLVSDVHRLDARLDDDVVDHTRDAREVADGGRRRVLLVLPIVMPPTELTCLLAPSQPSPDPADGQAKNQPAPERDAHGS